MKKRIFNMATSYICTCFFILLTSCTTEEKIDQMQVYKLDKISDAKDWFTKKVTVEDFELLKYTKDIQWSKAIFSTGDKGEMIEVPFTVNSNLKSKVGKENYVGYHRLLLRKSATGFTYNHVQILTTKKDFDNSDNSFNFYQITDHFDGIVLVVNENKKIVQFSDFKDSILKTSVSTSKMAFERCVYMGWLYESGDFQAIMLVGCYGGGGEYGSNSDNVGYPPHVGRGGGGITAGNKAQTIEDQIDDSKLDPCTKGVLDKLKNLSGGDITNMLKRFTPPGSIFIINMKTGQVSNQNDWAQTTPINGSRTDINMVFNENYINGTNNSSRPTDLSVATTMAHEVIHAYLISLLEENKACGASGICDFPTVFDAYVQQQITKDPSITVNSHHELIANNYVNTIAATIQEFHTGQSVSNPSQEYLDLAWGGLTGTQIFIEKYPNEPNDKNYNERVRIFARINTEKLGTQYGINSPIGTPCKK